jgi:hypothetical protein
LFKNDVIAFEANMMNTWPGVLFTEQARRHLSKQVRRRKMVASEVGGRIPAKSRRTEHIAARRGCGDAARWQNAWQK